MFLRKTFIPVMFGGGITSIEDINNLLNLGIDRFSINTAALKDPNLISKIANKIGSANLVLSIECKKINNDYYAYGEMGRYNSGFKVQDWINQVLSLGAGEIIINSIDNDGTGKGLDFDLIKKINETIPIPIIISGGVGKKQDILDLIENYDFNAIAISSILHYDLINKNKTKSNSKIGNKNFINNFNIKKNIETCSLKDIKKFLKEKITNNKIIKIS